MNDGSLLAKEAEPGLQLQLPGVFKEIRQSLLSKSHGRSTALRGSAWVIAGLLASKFLRGTATLILARLLLDPKDFGLFAIVNAFIAGIAMLSDLGISTAVIRHPRGEDNTFVGTAFILQAVRGIILFFIAALLAYPFATFYHQREVALLASVAAAEVLIKGFTSGSVWTLSRGVQTHKLAVLTIISDSAGFIGTIVWAFISPSVWALVAGKIASAIGYVIASHFLSKVHRTVRWDSNAAREIMSFAGGMLLSSATFFLVVEGQRLALAKFISVAELGYFSLAMSISTLPDQFVGNLVDKIFFPMISKTVSHNSSNILTQYKMVRVLVLIASSVMAVGFIAFGPFVTTTILGAKYETAGWMVQLLGVRAAFSLFSCVASYMLFALGYSRYSAFGNTSKLVFLSIGLSIAFGWYGMRQAVWVISLAPIAAYVPLLSGLRQHLRGALKTEVAAAAVLMGASLVTAGLLHSLDAVRHLVLIQHVLPSLSKFPAVSGINLMREWIRII